MPSDEAKSVKKMEDADEKSLSFLLESRKKKPTNGKVKKEEPKDDDGDFQKPLRKAASGSKVKKEHNAIDDDDNKPITKKKSSASIKADNNKEVKKKKSKGEEKKAEAEAEQKGRKERKVYDLPGQKRDPPEERDPLRIFYETLYKQVPNSEMAQFWMMESGLLSFNEAKKVFEKKQKRNKFCSPTKTISSVKRTTESVTVKRKPPSSLVSSNRKMTTDSKVAVKQSKKQKLVDGSSEADSDDDLSIKKGAKKQKAK